MSDQFPPAPPPPPPPPPPQQPYQHPQQQPQPQQHAQTQYGYAQQPPPVKTGMSGGLKALLIIGAILAGLGVLTFGGLIVVGALVANEAEEIVNTAASDLDEDLDDLEEDENPFASDGEDEDEDEDTGGSKFGSSSDDEEVDLVTWCGTVDEFDAFTRASSAGFSEAQITEKILTVDEMIDVVRDTAPSEFEGETEEILVPFEETVALFESVDFDASQITADDQAALNESFEDALPSVIAVRQACLDEGVSVFENNG